MTAGDARAGLVRGPPQAGSPPADRFPGDAPAREGGDHRGATDAGKEATAATAQNLSVAAANEEDGGVFRRAAPTAGSESSGALGSSEAASAGATTELGGPWGPPAGSWTDPGRGDKRRRECQTAAEEFSDPGPAKAATTATATAPAAGRGGRGRRGKRFRGAPPRQSNNNGMMHPRSRFFGGPLNFPLLAEKHPPLSAFLSASPSGFASFDFRTREAQLELCIALFKCIYSLSFSLPLEQNLLIPTLPNRSNYIHFLADLLSQTEGLWRPTGPPIQGGGPYIIKVAPDDPSGSPPRETTSHSDRTGGRPIVAPDEHEGPPKGPQIRVLDIGVGANCVYPLLGVADYDWSFVGVDISETSLAIAAENIKANNYEGRITLRKQQDRNSVFHGIVLGSDPLFAASVCNPPFYTSEESIGINPKREKGGNMHELVCDGGEEAFLSRMYSESKIFCSHFLWFTTLVARATTRDALKKEIHEGMRAAGKKQEKAMQGKADEWLRLYNSSCKDGTSSAGAGDSTCSSSTHEEEVEMHPRELRIFELSQGKQTRWVVCWTYWTKDQRTLIRRALNSKS